MGVTSLMDVMRNPDDWIPRNADSRPAPGPETRIATVWTPCSWALREASSAANWAAKGVDLRDPLKPRTPAEAHERTLPLTSVTVTKVLLKVEQMCTTPAATFFFTFRFPGLGFVIP